MAKRRLLTTIGTLVSPLLLSMPGHAEVAYLFGKIDGHPVGMRIDRQGDALTGWYFYRSAARLIQLDGKIAADGAFQMEEQVDFKTTGLFEGGVRAGRWNGNWRKSADDPAVAFELEEIHGQYDRLAGDYHCSLKEHDHQFNYAYRHNLDLSMAAGRIKAFTATQAAYADDGSDEHACEADLSYLQQVQSGPGLLLATQEAEGDIADNVCTIRIVGDAETLWIRFGDATAAGDPCRGDEYRMYCAPRAGWRDVLVDRRSGKCRMLGD